VRQNLGTLNIEFRAEGDWQNWLAARYRRGAGQPAP
jgi:hypothetical protein